MIPPPPRSTLFPYTTLFRSVLFGVSGKVTSQLKSSTPNTNNPLGRVLKVAEDNPNADNETLRSEEHTSELQSRPHLVCRLLLEKKNRHTDNTLIQFHYTSKQ